MLYDRLKISAIFSLILLGAVIIPSALFARTVIRDTEIEHVLTRLTQPIYKAAGLAPENIQMLIIKDDNVNAFVSGGMNIFVNTGLLALSEDPLLFLGVMAHETGHIAGGHLIQTEDALSEASIKATMGYLLGIGAAALGSPEAAAAIISGGGHLAERQLLKYTRQHEEEADQSAIVYLAKLKRSPSGLLDLLQHLNRIQAQQIGTLNPYLLSHPLTHERIAHIRSYLESNQAEVKEPTRADKHDFKRIIIKLKAFLQPAEHTLADYPESDKSDEAYLARSIAYYKIPELDKSLTAIDILITKYPNDPYYVELKGQILFENGHIAKAAKMYRYANKRMPNEPLIQIQYARTLAATNEKKAIKEAVILLRGALSKEPANIFAWRQLAIQEGILGNIGLSKLALAEEAHLLGKKDEALALAEQAISQLDKDSPAMIRAHDLQSVLKSDT